LRLEPIQDGGYYDVKTSFITRPDYLKNIKLLWERAQTSHRKNTIPGAFSGHNSTKKIDFSNKNKPDGISGDFSQKGKNTHQPSPGSPNKIDTSSKNNKISDHDPTNNRRGKKDMGRPSGKSKGGDSPTRDNPVYSVSDPLVYLGEVVKLEIDTPEGTRILKRGKDDKPTLKNSSTRIRIETHYIMQM